MQIKIARPFTIVYLIWGGKYDCCWLHRGVQSTTKIAFSDVERFPNHSGVCRMLEYFYVYLCSHFLVWGQASVSPTDTSCYLQQFSIFLTELVILPVLAQRTFSGPSYTRTADCCIFSRFFHTYLVGCSIFFLIWRTNDKKRAHVSCCGPSQTLSGLPSVPVLAIHRYSLFKHSLKGPIVSLHSALCLLVVVGGKNPYYAQQSVCWIRRWFLSL